MTTGEIIKEYKTISKSKVFLVKDNNKLFIRKINNIERNYNQMLILKELNLNIPLILKKEDDILEMEYIDGINMIDFFKNHRIELFLEFIYQLVDTLSKKSKNIDYTDIYIKKLNEIENFDNFIFSKNELLEKLPKILPESFYHGDLTLDNIIFLKNKFYLIDCLTTEYSSWVFDFIKLRQDLECKWFLRDIEEKNKFNFLEDIQSDIIKKYPLLNNDYLLILMLLRVYNYTENNLINRSFIINNVNSLWK